MQKSGSVGGSFDRFVIKTENYGGGETIHLKCHLKHTHPRTNDSAHSLLSNISLCEISFSLQCVGRLTQWSDLNATSAAKLPSIPCGKRHIHSLTAAATFRSWHKQNVLGAATDITSAGANSAGSDLYAKTRLIPMPVKLCFIPARLERASARVAVALESDRSSPL